MTFAVGVKTFVNPGNPGAIKDEMINFVNANYVGVACKFTMEGADTQVGGAVFWDNSGSPPLPVTPEFNGMYGVQSFQSEHGSFEESVSEIASWMSNNLTREQFSLASIDTTGAYGVSHGSGGGIWIRISVFYPLSPG